MTTGTELVLIDRPEDGVVLVRINRPEARNALNLATRTALAAAFEGLHDDPSVRAIVLTGNEQAPRLNRATNSTASINHRSVPMPQCP